MHGQQNIKSFLTLALIELTVSFLHRPLLPGTKIAMFIGKEAGWAGKPR
jgi:hypothetical protein